MKSPAKTLQAVILVGGMGSRLGALTKATPKPLLTVAGRPFLDYLLWILWRYGFEDVVLLSGFHAGQIEEFAAQCDYPGMEISCITEPALAGTGGALRHAAPRLGENFLLMNGDSLFDINLLDLVDVNKGLGSRLGRLALYHLNDTSRSGVVRLSGERISHFASRPEQDGLGLINGGIYWLSRDILKFIPTPPCSLEQDVFPKLAESQRLDGRVFDNFFIDIGIVDDLARSEELIPVHFHRPAVFLTEAALRETGGAVTKAIRKANDDGYYVFILSEVPISGFNDRLRGVGAHIDGLLKPDEASLRQAMKRWTVRKKGSILIGDRTLADSLGITVRAP